MEELGEHVPRKFLLGYFEGQRSTKHWLFSDDDITAMYDKCRNNKEIILWCETNEEYCEPPRKKQRKSDDSNGRETKRQEKENRVVEIAEELKERHSDKLQLSEAQFRLWARLYVSGVHGSLDEPPNVPMITGVTPRLAKRMSVEEAIASTAQSFAQAISGKTSNVQQTLIHTRDKEPSLKEQVSVSPGKRIKIRGKSYSQLATLKQLHNDGILSDIEFEEQKQIILDDLKKV